MRAAVRRQQVRKVARLTSTGSSHAFRAFRRCKIKQNVAASFVFGFAVLVLLCALLYFVFGPRTLLAKLSNYCESRVLGAVYRPSPGASHPKHQRSDRL